ncbi:lytic transglycosylase domain-containing protein [Sphingomonas quercus]|uniref:Lytic transglycosylase domain-containing protein n=1 Tax=Sphingomonas quercus TaxID=2842451 RepID=A0ABS6BJ30_9SPHN|nr:lytic transglycosylase domain-containing protein [Sphingomonas quercus]MBU3077436.1 lytic transglycosylase domain-containing protein [Sphingomonas quercus]
MSSMPKKLVLPAALIASVAAAATYQTDWPGASAPVVNGPSAPLALNAAPRAVVNDPAIGIAVGEWNRLRQSDALPFSDYAAFLIAHPGWPGETALRRAAEKAIRVDQEQPAQVIALFQRMPPLSGVGHARYADALMATGRAEEARGEARAAWTGGGLPAEEEARVQSRYGAAFTAEDQDKRMERLLWDRAAGAASRQLAFVSAARQPLYAARLAMQMRSPQADSLAEALRPAADRDPGFELDRAMWLRDTARSPEARAYLARSGVVYDGLPFDPEKWLEGMLTIARGAAADSQWSLAYGIAARLDAAFPAGTNVRERTAGERDDYTSLAWLGGYTAFKRLARPADAMGMFARYAAASRTPQSQSKGQYWAGRAAAAAGQQPEATSWLTQAASHYDQFYGQLASERLGKPLPLPSPPSVMAVTPTAQAAFDANELVRAVRWLGQNGRWQDQTQFVRAIAASLKDEGDHLLATRLAVELARPDLGVMVARAARLDGSTDYARSGFPEVKLPASLSYQWVMVHSIARQESQFDREAISVAGARGLMQLMTPTARQTASKAGIPFDAGRLTSDPAYNMALGSAYFAELLDRFGGNHVLAVAAYNAGPGNVAKFIRANGDPRDPGVDVVDWIEAIPFTETRGYVQRVLENAVVYDLMNPDKARMRVSANRLSAYLGKTSAG